MWSPSSGKLVPLRRSIEVWGNFSSAKCGTALVRGCTRQTHRGWGPWRTLFPEQPGMWGNGHKKPACLEVRADFKEHY